MQVPFFLPSGYGVAEGNGATAPSPMKGLLSGAKRQPRSITRRFKKKVLPHAICGKSLGYARNQ